MKLLVRGETRLVDICNRVVCPSELNCCLPMDGESAVEELDKPDTSYNYKVL